MEPRLSPPTAPASRAEPCASCGVGSALQVTISQEGTGRRISVCQRCLRSNLRLKADLSETRSHNLLHDYAEELGCTVWRGQGALYLLPPSGPFRTPLVAAP